MSEAKWRRGHDKRSSQLITSVCLVQHNPVSPQLCVKLQSVTEQSVLSWKHVVRLSLAVREVAGSIGLGWG